ncbi:hypothetical protein J6590_013604, partial [Homalodisca vitripennis]
MNTAWTSIAYALIYRLKSVTEIQDFSGPVQYVFSRWCFYSAWKVGRLVLILKAKAAPGTPSFRPLCMVDTAGKVEHTSVRLTDAIVSTDNGGPIRPIFHRRHPSSGNL